MKLNHEIIRPNLFKVFNFYLDKYLALESFIIVEKTLADLFPSVLVERFEVNCKISEVELDVMNSLGIIPKELECALRDLANGIFIKLPVGKRTVGIVSLPLEKEKEQELAYPSDYDSKVFKESGQCIYLSCYKVEQDFGDEVFIGYKIRLVMECKIV